MSAHAYIQYGDVPDELTSFGRQHTDEATGAKLIAFEDCPFSGKLDWTENGLQIEYAWPHSLELRHALSDWFTYHGIHFTVVM
ncbi:phage portal protein [Paraburkholderia sediminicola]|uniref:phage portal protein n=1 Tax=Paraburkholderia sediminicola TaxID=458836 RepID=UPI0038B94F0F